MEMKLHTIIAATAFGMMLLLGRNASAQAAGNDTYEYVTKVTVKGDGRVWINVKGNFSSAHGCPETGFGVTTYELSDDRTKAWLQIALASFLARSKVYVESINCSAIGNDVGHPVITALQIYRED
jgi:hypothetical protein